MRNAISRRDNGRAPTLGVVISPPRPGPPRPAPPRAGVYCEGRRQSWALGRPRRAIDRYGSRREAMAPTAAMPAMVRERTVVKRMLVASSTSDIKYRNLFRPSLIVKSTTYDTHSFFLRRSRFSRFSRNEGKVCPLFPSNFCFNDNNIIISLSASEPIGAHAPTQTARHTAASSIHPSSRFRGWYVPPNCAPEELE